MNRPRAYEGTEPYIFISYAHLDSDRVLPIISALQERGFRVWYDAGIEAGTEWIDYIAEQVNHCGAFLAFISNHSLKSRHCHREINYAIGVAKKEPLAIYMEEDLALSPGMQMQLCTVQAMYHNRHNTMESFLEELCKSRLLTACLEKPKTGQTDPNADTSAEKAGETCKTPEVPSAHIQEKEKNKAAAFSFRLRSAEELAQVKKERDLLHHQGQTYERKGKYAEAFRCYEKAAIDFMHTDSQFELGCAYLAGRGTEKDETAAVHWFRIAAELNHLDARYNLGVLLMKGRGTAQDMAAAADCFRIAAEKGHEKAQLALCRCYTHGLGVPKDKVEAIEWCEKAAKQGLREAKQELKALKK